MSERVLFYGSRTWVESVPIWWHIYGLKPGDVVIHGGADGADEIADEAARKSGLRVEVYRANWREHGRAAGPRRNQQMIDEGKPDRAVGFRMPGTSKGTDDMTRRLQAAAIPYEVIAP